MDICGSSCIQLSASDVIKFVTNDFIPVKTLGAKSECCRFRNKRWVRFYCNRRWFSQWDVENAAVDGAIYHYIVEQAGSGYTLDSGFTVDVEC